MSKNIKVTNSPNGQNEEISSASKKLLNRKTKRENNNNSSDTINKFQLSLANEIKCSICLKYQKFGSNCYKCSICSSYFHLDCYNLFTFTKDESDQIKIENKNLNDFKCVRCIQEKINNTKYQCYLCWQHEGIMKKIKDNQYIHHYCYVFFKDNLLHPKNGKCKNCRVKNIPTLKCEWNGCKDKYHIKCALEKGIIFSLQYMRFDNDEKIEIETFNEKVTFFCEIHNNNLIENYYQYLSVMTQSLNDRIDNNPINEINNNNEKKQMIDSNNDKEKEKNNISNINSNNNEQKSIENNNEEIKNDMNKSISSNSNFDNYDSNNDSEVASEKTPVNHYSSEKKSINEKISESEKNFISNDNSNNNKINNSQNNKEINEKSSNVNLNNENKIKNNINNEDEEKVQMDINMDIEEEEKNKIEIEESKIEKKNNDKIEEDEDEEIIITKKNKISSPKNELIEEENFQPPEIKREKIDLFDSFRKINEDYCFPGCFYRFHGI